MRCGKVRKILFTAYVDGELTEKTRQEVLAHMEKCGKCREVEKDVREIAVYPFVRARKHFPSEEVWRNIKSRVEAGLSQGRISAALERVRETMFFRKKVFAVAAACILAVIIIPRTYNNSQNRKIAYFLSEEMDFLDSLGTGNGAFSLDLGIPMEDLFM
ncbi:MAG: zf-HC2 domain-containing protein [Candidatus Omnitrophota bacterium]